MQNQQQLDPQVVNLAKAIRQTESNGNFQAQGKSGEYGAYQYTPDTWAKDSQQYLGQSVDLKQATPQQQNEVAYKKLAALKAKGYNIGQIASIWNAGEDEPNAYTGKFSNGQSSVGEKNGVRFDVPQYAKSVASTYQQYKAGIGSPTITPNLSSVGSQGEPQTQEKAPEPSLGEELGQRGQDIGSAVSKTISGKINPISGLIQTAGAVAGGLGDVVGKGLELIPGVKGIENLIGKGVGALAKTGAGQAVIKEVQKFSDDHPELSGDIGAGFNILTAIPIFKGLGAVKNVAEDAISSGLKSVAEKSFVSDAPNLFTTAKAQTFLEKNPTVLKDMVDRRLVGDIEGGKYVVGNSIDASQKSVGDLNKQVEKALSDAKYANTKVDGEGIAHQALTGFTDRNGNVIEGVPQSGMTEHELIANAKKLDPTNKLLWDKFENGEATLNEVNQLRSSLDGKVKKVFLGPTSLDSPEVATSKELGALLSSAMRDSVQATAPETQNLFKEMATQFKIQRALGYMNGKSVKPGSIAKFAGNMTSIGAGGGLGGLIGGTPGAVIGGIVGERTGGTIAKKLAQQNIVQGILKRTGNKAIRTPLIDALKKVGGLIGGVAAQKANPQK
jgi:hypothetical protein